MTDNEKMRAEYERMTGKSYPEGADFRSDYEMGFHDAWKTCAAQSAETIARLEKVAAAAQADNMYIRGMLAAIDGKGFASEHDKIRIRSFLAQLLDTSALDAYVASKMPAWQPIETAPRDGTLILAILPDSDTVHTVTWGDPNLGIRLNLGDAKGWRMAWDGTLLNDYHNHPTHWMHLLPSPISKESRG